MKNTYVAILSLIIGVIAFYAGTSYQKNRAQSAVFNSNQRENFRFSGNGQNGMRQATQDRRGAFGGRVSGEIIKIDGDTITVKLPDDSSRLVTIDSDTSYTRSQMAQKTDLRVGMKIGVFGSRNEGETVDAQTIQIDPPMVRLDGRP